MLIVRVSNKVPRECVIRGSLGLPFPQMMSNYFNNLGEVITITLIKHMIIHDALEM
jgi:hypothetical protein